MQRSPEWPHLGMHVRVDASQDFWLKMHRFFPLADRPVSWPSEGDDDDDDDDGRLARELTAASQDALAATIGLPWPRPSRCARGAGRPTFDELYTGALYQFVLTHAEDPTLDWTRLPPPTRPQAWRPGAALTEVAADPMSVEWLEEPDPTPLLG